MKDELINIINKKAERNRRLMNVSTSFTTKINALVTLLFKVVKLPENYNIKEASLMKNFFSNLG